MLIRPSAPASIVSLERLRDKLEPVRDVTINVLRRLEETYTHIARVLNMEEQSEWIDLTLQNSWVENAGDYETPGYRKAWGIVWLQGRAKDGTGTTLATLPADYRPANTLIFRPHMSDSTSLIVNTDGTLVLTTSGAGHTVSLDGVQFDAL